MTIGRMQGSIGTGAGAVTGELISRSSGWLCAGLGVGIGCASLQPVPLCAQTVGDFEPQGPTFRKSSEEPKPDKSQYSLWNPTPQDQLRDINALYNGPYTVDAGHFQIETVGALYAIDHNTDNGADVSTKFLSIASTTLRLGLLNNWDIGVTIPPRVELKIHDRIADTRTVQRGFGDVVVRSKLNLWGNDGGSSAFGLVGFVKLPTNENGLGNEHVEGGIGIPLALELPRGWWLGVTPEFHCYHDVNGEGYHVNFSSTVFLWHKIAGNLSGYIEMANWVSAESGSPWISTLDLGLTYVAGKHFQFDLGTYIGLTRAANDFTPFFGIAYRY